MGNEPTGPGRQPRHRRTDRRRAGLCAVALLLAGQATADEADWLPGALGELAATGPVQALEPGGLYGYMNGGADILLELGLERLWVRRYASGPGPAREELVAELYRLTDPQAALGVLWLKGGRDAPGQALRRVGRHLLCATWRPGAKLPEAASGKLVALLADHLPASKPAPSEKDLLKLLPAENRIEGSRRVVRGPLGLEGFYTLGEGDVLRLRRPGRAATGLLARYRDAQGREQSRLAIAYPTPEAARQAFLHLAGHLEPSLRIESREDARLVFADNDGIRGTVTLAGRRLSILLAPEALP
jgi:hypothetical protein